MAGASREAVTADYALTDERLPDVIARLSRRETYRAGLAAADPRALRCDPRTMEILLTTLDAEHGGAAGWLRTAGVPGPALARIRDRLRGDA